MLGMRFHNCGGHSNMIYTTFILFQWPVTSSVDVSAFTLFFFLVIYSSVCWYHNTKLHILWLKYIQDSSNVTTLSWRIFFRGVKWKGHCCLSNLTTYFHWCCLILPQIAIYKKKKITSFYITFSFPRQSFTEKCLCFSSDGDSDLS